MRPQILLLVTDSDSQPQPKYAYGGREMRKAATVWFAFAALLSICMSIGAPCAAGVHAVRIQAAQLPLDGPPLTPSSAPKACQFYFWLGTSASIMSMFVASVAYCSSASCASVMLMAACTAGCLFGG